MNKFVISIIAFVLLAIVVVAIAAYSYNKLEVKIQPTGSVIVVGQGKSPQHIDVPDTIKTLEIDPTASSVITSGPVINIQTGPNSPTITGDSSQIHYENKY